MMLTIMGMAEKAIARNQAKLAKAKAVQAALDHRHRELEGFMKHAYNKDTAKAATITLDKVELQIASIEEQLEAARDQIEAVYRRMYPSKAFFKDGYNLFGRLRIKCRKSNSVDLGDLAVMYVRAKENKLKPLTAKEKKLFTAREIQNSKKRLIDFLLRAMEYVRDHGDVVSCS